jgi:TonB-linked SusC/RagA family outer membrane protein
MKKTNFNSPLNRWSDKSMWSAVPVPLIRKAAFLLIFFCLPFFCVDVQAQTLKREITFGLNDEPLKNGLDTLEKVSGFRLSYILNQVTPYEHVTVKTGTRTVEATLKLLLEKTNLIYELKGSNILIYEKQKEEGKADGDAINVTGVVADESGYPLPGVNIVNKRTLTGTVPDNLGKFQINALTGDTLMFSFVGYKTVEVRVTDQQPLNIRLEEDFTAIKEVVINAGYYTVKNQERTGSITTVTAREIENKPVSNVLSAVQGQMAGVNIVQNSGMPGGGYNVQIRGINSLRSKGNYPMYIINGVPVSAETPSYYSATTYPDAGEISVLNAINPNDIESIEILKDADATAIYGSRGANGVILITTKKGKEGDKTRFSVNGSYGLSRVASKMELMNTEQYLEMRRQAYANDGITTYPSNAYDINGTWDQTRYTDWQEELIGNTAANSTVQFSLSGGGDNSGFILSGSHNEQTTVYGHDFRYKTNNLSGSMSHHSKDNRFMLNASGLFSAQSNNVIQTDITTSILMLCPDAPALYSEDGSVNWENNTFYDNPAGKYESSYRYKSNTFNTNINLQYELFNSFYIKLNGGIDYVAFDDLVLYPSTQYNPAWGITPSSSMSLKGQNQRFSYLFEPQLNYKHTFREHQIDVLVGGTCQQTQAVSLNVCGYGFTSNALITNVAAANNIYVYSDNPTDYKYAAVFGRLNYQYKNRYIVNFTGRRDGSSRFGPNNRFANFGAIGAAWLFSKENFLSDMQWLSFGKLRASYGLTGSDLIGDYQYLDTYTVSSSMYGGSTTMYPSRLYNPYFSWEKTSKLEIALETGFLNDRVRFTAAWYRNRSGNQLVGIPLPATTGFSSVQANLPAIVENKGLEMELNTIPVRTENFKWNSNLNISLPRNKLVAFPGLEGSTYANTYVIGFPVTIAKVYNYTGINQATGYYTFTDYNEDGSISTPDDNQVIEDIGIKLFGGWTNEFSFRNWSFSFLLQFVSQKQWNYLSQGTGHPGTKYNKPVELLDVWSEDNPSGRFMPYTTGVNSQKNKVLSYFGSSTAAISDASFIRLKNIQLSYRLPVNGNITDILMYVQGQNLLTITDYFGLDPEFVSIGFLPPLKTWSFGIQLSF